MYAIEKIYMMHDMLTQMMQEPNELRFAKTHNLENWPIKSSFMKNFQFMKNKNPNFSKTHKLTNWLSQKVLKICYN